MVSRPGSDPNLQLPSKIVPVNTTANPSSPVAKKSKTSVDGSNRLLYAENSQTNSSDNMSITSDMSLDDLVSTNQKAVPTKTTGYHLKTPPIILDCADWCKAAPSIIKNGNVNPENLSAKINSDGKITILTKNSDDFRIVQNTLHFLNIAFITRSLPANRMLKVILRGIPTDITEKKLSNDLSCRGFNVVLVKRFGPKEKSFLMCLVVIKKDLTALQIYDITNIFYINIKVEAYKQTGPSQFFSCQNFGHGSQNCYNKIRCVKCGGDHIAKECTLKPDSNPLCYNCGGEHTANYRGCPFYKNIASTIQPTPKPKQKTPDIPTPTKFTVSNH